MASSSAIFKSIKDDVVELVKVGIVSIVFSIPYHLVFKEWSLTVLFFVIMYATLLNSSYIVSIDKKLRIEGRI